MLIKGELKEITEMAYYMENEKNRDYPQKGALGNAIRQARIEKKLSQETLAELVGITPTHLKHIESEHRKPSVEVLFRLVRELHFSLDSLLAPGQDEKEDLLHAAFLLLGQCDEKQLSITIALMEALLSH